MRKYRLYQCLVGIALLGGLALPAWAETVELVTYYPTTSNIPDELRVKSLTVGTAYKTTPTTLEDGVVLISNRLGIGTTNPDPNFALHLSQPIGVNTAILLDTLSNAPGSVGSRLFLQRARVGTGSTPSAVGAYDLLGDVLFMGYDGSTYRDGAAIAGLTEGSWTSGPNGSRPAMLQFYTRPADPGALPAERMRITSEGNVGIGTMTPQNTSPANGVSTGNLDVNDVYLRSVERWASQRPRGLPPPDYDTGWVIPQWSAPSKNNIQKATFWHNLKTMDTLVFLESEDPDPGTAGHFFYGLEGTYGFTYANKTEEKIEVLKRWGSGHNHLRIRLRMWIIG